MKLPRPVWFVCLVIWLSLGSCAPETNERVKALERQVAAQKVKLDTAVRGLSNEVAAHRAKLDELGQTLNATKTRLIEATQAIQKKTDAHRGELDRLADRLEKLRPQMGKPGSNKRPPDAKPAAPAKPPGTTVKVIITSKPVGAQVYIENALVGRTPVELQQPRTHRSFALRLHKTGYYGILQSITFKQDQTLAFALKPSVDNKPRKKKK